MKLKSKSVDPIKHLWIAVQRWKNRLKASGLKSRLFKAWVDELRIGGPNSTLAALFWSTCSSDIMVRLFLSPQMRSPQSKSGRIKVLYRVTLAWKGSRFLTLLIRPILWLISLQTDSMWSAQDIDWWSVTPKWFCSIDYSTLYLNRYFLIRFSLCGLPKMTKLHFDKLRVRRFLENHSDTVSKSTLRWCWRSVRSLDE